MAGPHVSFTVTNLPTEIAGAETEVPALVVAEASEWKVRNTVQATLIAVSVALIAFAIAWHRQLGLLFFGGIVLAVALQPVIRLLESRLRMNHAWATVVVYSLFTLLLIGSVVLLLPELVSQGRAFWERLPGFYDQGRDFLLASSNRTLRTIGNRVPVTMPEITGIGLMSLGLGDSSNSPLSMLWQIGTGMLGCLAVGVLAFYWSTHEEATTRSILQLAPDHRREFYQDLVDELLRKLGGYVRGQLLLCAAVGVLSLIAFLLIGLPYSLMLALIAGVLEAVPIIGPTLGAVPAILVALSLGPEQTALVIVAAMCVQTLENYLLVPSIMGSSVGLGAVVTLVAIVACGALFGVVGAIFAIPLAAVCQTLFERLVLQADFKTQEFTSRRDAAGVLHYELQDLINDIKRQQRQKDTPADLWTTESFAEIETLAVTMDEMIRDELEDAVPARTVAKVTVT
ncbi:AI-2E family transporter [Anatilimnocola floriformis]|uniref:AI-2E family transporter n=1 Tax=Anatilimnocola floriformis TaxID=2948575 RepID=UPI0020C1F787|nr:AI-2E family transporter [Anatilimnocola floriformis]